MGTKGMQIASYSDNRVPYGVVVCDKTKDDPVPAGFPVLHRTSLQAVRKLQHLFVLCSALHLPQAARFLSEINREHKLQALFVRTDADPTLLPQMLERAKLRLVHNMLVHTDSCVPRRVLSAWQHDAQTELIANATVAGDRLILISCEPKTYEIRFDQMPALKKVAPSERRDFKIAEDGSFIWWPSGDVHLDLDAIKSVVDPVWRRKSDRLRRAHGEEYGAAIAAVRKQHGLKQTNVPAISQRQLRRIEQSGDVSVRALKGLAEAHAMTLDDYMNAVAAKIRTAPGHRSKVVAGQ
jgi:hypothetical protein